MTQKLLTLTLFLGGGLLLLALVTNKGSIKVSDGISAFYTVGVAHAYDDGDGSGPGQGCGGCGVGTGSGPGSADGGGNDGGAVGPGTGFGACPGWCGGGNDSGGSVGGTGTPSGTVAPVCPDGSLQPTEQNCGGDNGSCVTVYDPCPTPAAPPPAAPTCPDGSVQPSHKNCNFTSIFAALCPVIYDACPVPPPTNPSAQPPVSPTSLSGSCVGTTAQVSWAPDAADTAYDLRVNDTVDGWGDSIPCSAQSSNDTCIDNYTATTKTFTGVPGHTYAWWVHGVNASGVSAPTGGTSFTCPTTTPSPPSTFEISCDTTNGSPLTLAWSSSSGATTYSPGFFLPTTATCPSGWTSTLTGGVLACQTNTTGTSVTASIPLNTPIVGVVYAGNGAGYSLPSALKSATCSAPVTAALSASPTKVVSGSQTTLNWSSTNATSCVSAGGFDTGGRTSGSALSVPLTTNPSNFQVTCTGSGGSATANTSVTVTSPAVTISASPTRVLSDNKTIVTWTATDVDSCDITRNDTPWKSGLTGAALNSSSPDTITGQTVYKIICTDASAKAHADSVVVNTGDGGFEEF